MIVVMYTSNATAASYNDQLSMQSIMKMPLYTCITLLITNKTDCFKKQNKFVL